jgi:hypothetical protein
MESRAGLAGHQIEQMWVDGELVDRLGVGVDEGAHVDVPGSLRRRQVGR